MGLSVEIILGHVPYSGCGTTKAVTMGTSGFDDKIKFVPGNLG